MKDRPITSHDVARLAGVSQSAVSRAFTPDASISPALREKVRAVAARLGYQPNLLPRMMIKGRSGIVAIVVGGGYNPFHAATLEAFSHALQQAGKRIMLVQAQSDRMLDEMVGDLIGYRVDGVVTALSILSPKAADAITAHRIPVVTLNSGITSTSIHVVGIDNEGAGRAAANHMLARGARRFSYVGADSVASRAREKGYRQAIASAGLSPPLCLSGTLDHGGGMTAGRIMLQASDRSDAIFCVNDLTAIGVMDVWRLEAGLSFPGDAQIIGFDDIPASAWPGYALTTINQNVDQMATCAIDLIENPREGPADPHLVDFRVIVRSTTGTSF
ncbi:transcriptional regulator, LacI family [Sphingobium sp. YR657]|uniref:LacI family DNA-binding transcriptional regulator n=1 Tax=Sphingobium sp. YR657 TaxID=1884366 RepID=UPI00091B4E89|nr:LacI family DNA-binding transcriptional regulator [Sphingobium sp. YR657]SHM44037.1 transcriptional regulator, LacI family [Sphingobium sp. YR657]